MTAAFERTTTAMGTVVTIRLAGGPAADRPVRAQRALDWFARVEECCSRFDPSSELRRMGHHVGHPFAASEILFEATRFALAVARASDGAFDPTVGTTMESLGYDVAWQTGERAPSRLPVDATVSWPSTDLRIKNVRDVPLVVHAFLPSRTSVPTSAVACARSAPPATREG